MKTNEAPVTTVILTLNEAVNLPQCLKSLSKLGSPVFVVDSGSSDQTVEIAKAYGARVVEHVFESHARQWQWGLSHLTIETPWVLGLDADQRLSPELCREIAATLAKAETRQVSGFFIKRRQIFRGRWIKHGGYYPKYLLKLFRLSKVSLSENDLVDHHFRVQGPTARLRGDLIEDNRKERDISVWIEKHSRYAALQASEEVRDHPFEELSVRAAFFGSPDERVLWMKRAWGRLPLFVRPSLYFFYRYFFRLGFLDGKEGFIFHFLQAFWYRLLVDIHLEELRRAESAPQRTRRSQRQERKVLKA